MKLKIASLFTVAAAALSFSNIALGSEEADVQERSTQLEEHLDQVCADTFCGGDIDFRDFQILCDSEQCTIEARVTEYFTKDSPRLEEILADESVLTGFVEEAELQLYNPRMEVLFEAEDGFEEYVGLTLSSVCMTTAINEDSLVLEDWKDAKEAVYLAYLNCASAASEAFPYSN